MKTINITFNAFSFLQEKLRKKDIKYSDAHMELKSGISAGELRSQMGLRKEDVEAVFINGRVVPFDTVIKDRDRVGFVPYGTPGPYRVLLGFKNKN